MDEPARRRRVVHGWAFRPWSPQQVTAIRRYLETGDMNAWFPASYRKLHETVK
jgi:hypothetical protein